MKKVKYTELSDKKCCICKKPLKPNLVNRHTHASMDYVCNNVAKGKNEMIQHKKIKKDGVLITVEKKINFKHKQAEQIAMYASNSER